MKPDVLVELKALEHEGDEITRQVFEALNRSFITPLDREDIRSIAVDLKSPEGREIVTRLIARPGPDAGIFLTNLPSTGWLSYPVLRALRDDLIMVLLTGNRNGSSAIDYAVHPATGFPAITRPVGTGPVNSPLIQTAPRTSWQPRV